jgi:hypothetical protein
MARLARPARALPPNYLPPVPAPKTPEELQAMNVAPASPSCADVERTRKLIVWLMDVAHDCGWTGATAWLLDKYQDLTSTYAHCYPLR